MAACFEEGRGDICGGDKLGYFNVLAGWRCLVTCLRELVAGSGRLLGAATLARYCWDGGGGSGGGRLGVFVPVPRAYTRRVHMHSLSFRPFSCSLPYSMLGVMIRRGCQFIARAEKKAGAELTGNLFVCVCVCVCVCAP